MRAGTILSALLHLAVLLLILFGLPDLFKPDEEIIASVPVQLATLADITAQPKPKQKTLAPVAKPKPPPPAPKAPEPPKLEPEPQPQPAEQTPPTPPPPPEPPKPQPVETPPPEPPKPQPVETPPPEPPQPIAIPEKPKPQPPQEAKVEPPPAPIMRPKMPEPPKPKEQKKPKPQTADFNSLLKNLVKTQPQAAATPDTPPENTPPEPQSATSDISAPQITTSEKDALRQQIGNNWYLDPGKKRAEDMIVEIRVTVSPDGTVQSAQILDTARMATDEYYRAAAEAARRAILKSSPLHLPPSKFEAWKTIVMRFNPQGMMGL